jgi:hypothetical protein
VFSSFHLQPISSVRNCMLRPRSFLFGKSKHAYGRNIGTPVKCSDSTKMLYSVDLLKTAMRVINRARLSAKPYVLFSFRSDTQNYRAETRTV